MNTDELHNSILCELCNFVRPLHKHISVMETKKGPQVPDVENIFFYNKIISSTIIVITRFVKVTILNYLNRLMQN